MREILRCTTVGLLLIGACQDVQQHGPAGEAAHAAVKRAAPPAVKVEGATRGGEPTRGNEIATQGEPTRVNEIATQGGEPTRVNEIATQGGEPTRVNEIATQGGEPTRVGAAAERGAAQGLAPLSTAQRALLAAGGEERIISRREHFTVSNEYRHDLWFPYLRGLGGVHVGVATDQNYTLMAVAGSEVGYLVDLDRQVVRLHRVYMALIAASPGPDEFVARFDGEAQGETRALIEAGLADMAAADRSAAIQFVSDNREALRAYLGAVREAQGETWLSQPAFYDHMRQMVAGGRLRPINGNLTGKTAMATIAAGARALALPVTVLYLSNAEEYLSYTADFVDNVRRLPASPESVVLRTIHDRFAGWESCGEGDTRWNYQVQPLADFQRRLGERRNNARTAMLARAGEEGVIDRVARGVSVFKTPG